MKKLLILFIAVAAAGLVFRLRRRETRRPVIPGPPGRAEARVTDVDVTNVSGEAATVRWRTTPVARCQILFGTTTDYRSGTPREAEPATEHAAVLASLDPATTYHISVLCLDSQDEVSSSPDCTFKTAGVSYILRADLEKGNDGFVYVPDAFRGTSSASAVFGRIDAANDATGSSLYLGMTERRQGRRKGGYSAAWEHIFTVDEKVECVVISLSCRLVMAGGYEPEESAEALLAVNGILYGGVPNADYLIRMTGSGDGVNRLDSGWREFTVRAAVTAGRNSLRLGFFNNSRSARRERTFAWFDNITIRPAEPVPETDATEQ